MIRKIPGLSAPVPAEAAQGLCGADTPFDKLRAGSVSLILTYSRRAHTRATLFPQLAPALTLRRERDSPKALCGSVLFDKLNGVSRHSISGSHLRDNTGRDLRTKFVPHDHDRPHHQFTLELDGRPMPIQVGGSGGHRKGAFLPILTREPYGTVQGHPIASALPQLNAIQGQRGRQVVRCVCSVAMFWQFVGFHSSEK